MQLLCAPAGRGCADVTLTAMALDVRQPVELGFQALRVSNPSWDKMGLPLTLIGTYWPQSDWQSLAISNVAVFKMAR